MKSFTDSKGNNWTCTDNDNLQYGRQISETIFEFKEFEKFENGEEFEKLKLLEDKDILLSIEEDEFWITLIIDLSKYSKKQQDNNICHYYGSLDYLKELYSKCDVSELNWIIAECIFEQESGNY